VNEMSEKDVREVVAATGHAEVSQPGPTVKVFPYKGQVVLQFDRPTTTQTMTVEQARELALALRQSANQVQREGL